MWVCHRNSQNFSVWHLQSKSLPICRFQSAASRQHDTPRDDYNVAQTIVGSDACVKAGITGLGITGPSTIYKNLTFQELFDHEQENNEGVVASAEYGDTFTVDTGKFTGRSPKDKWLVKNIGSQSDTNVDWGKVNQATTPEVYEELYNRAVNYFNTRTTAYVFDGFCGASPKSKRKIQRRKLTLRCFTLSCQADLRHELRQVQQKATAMLLNFQTRIEIMSNRRWV